MDKKEITEKWVLNSFIVAYAIMLPLLMVLDLGASWYAGLTLRSILLPFALYAAIKLPSFAPMLLLVLSRLAHFSLALFYRAEMAADIYGFAYDIDIYDYFQVIGEIVFYLVIPILAFKFIKNNWTAVIVSVAPVFLSLFAAIGLHQYIGPGWFIGSLSEELLPLLAHDARWFVLPILLFVLLRWKNKSPITTVMVFFLYIASLCIKF